MDDILKRGIIKDVITRVEDEFPGVIAACTNKYSQVCPSCGHIYDEEVAIDAYMLELSNNKRFVKFVGKLHEEIENEYGFDISIDNIDPDQTKESRLDEYETEKRKREIVLYESDEGIAYVRFNRPKVHNAFDQDMLDELLDVFSLIEYRDQSSVIVLEGKGDTFCSGADTKYLDSIGNDYQKNYEFFGSLDECLKLLYNSDRWVVTKVQGNAVGGGVGWPAVSDKIFIDKDAELWLPETEHGMAAAVISSYIIERAGPQVFLEMCTGKRLSVGDAQNYKLLKPTDVVAPRDELDDKLNTYLNKLRKIDPKALAACKRLTRLNHDDSGGRIDIIAKLRSGL